MAWNWRTLGVFQRDSTGSTSLYGEFVGIVDIRRQLQKVRLWQLKSG